MPSDAVAERGRLSQHGGRPLSDDDAARLRERLVVSRAIEELRRPHWYHKRNKSVIARTFLMDRPLARESSKVESPPLPAKRPSARNRREQALQLIETGIEIEPTRLLCAQRLERI